MSRTVPKAQMDLLSWQPPEPSATFTPPLRAATLAGRISLAVSEVLKDQAAAGVDRETVATAMSAYLGEPVSKPMLDAYASQAREDHVINLIRFIALLSVTGDQRPLQMIASLFGWAVVDARFVPMIELASLREHEDTIRRRRQLVQAQLKSSGAL